MSFHETSFHETSIHKTSFHIMSFSTKRPFDKTFIDTKHPWIQNVLLCKTSNLQNVHRYKTSMATKRPSLHKTFKFFFIEITPLPLHLCWWGASTKKRPTMDKKKHPSPGKTFIFFVINNSLALRLCLWNCVLAPPLLHNYLALVMYCTVLPRL
jgi:hypothetical protein